MSTKTTFKRVALVAVAALGLGVLSVAPSQAAPVSLSLTPTATTSAITTSDTATISVAFSSVIGAATDSLTVNAVVTSSNVATKGTLWFGGTTDSTTPTVLAGGDYSANSYAVNAIPGSAVGSLLRGTLTLNMVKPTKAGTYSVLVYTTSGGSVQTADKSFVWTVTVTAPSTVPDSTSSARLVSGLWTAITDPTSDAAVTASKSAGLSVPAATIKVLQKNAVAAASEGLVVTVSGPGYLATDTTDTSTVASPVRALTVATAPAYGTPSYIKLLADGTSGVSTVTITSATSGVVLGTKTVTFSDTAPASITVTVKKAYVAAGANTAKVFAITLKDSAGNAITGSAASIAGARTDTTTAGKSLATAASACAWSSTDLVYYCDATGASSIVFGPAGYLFTATGTDAAATTVSAAAVTTTFADTVATKVTITAPATASVGDKITYTLTATEKNGYPIADNSYEGGTANGSLGAFWNTTTVPTYSSSVTASTLVKQSLQFQVLLLSRYTCHLWLELLQTYGHSVVRQQPQQVQSQQVSRVQQLLQQQ